MPELLGPILPKDPSLLAMISRFLINFQPAGEKTSTLLKPIGDVALRSFKIYITNIR